MDPNRHVTLGICGDGTVTTVGTPGPAIQASIYRPHWGFRLVGWVVGLFGFGPLCLYASLSEWRRRGRPAAPVRYGPPQPKP